MSKARIAWLTHWTRSEVKGHHLVSDTPHCVLCGVPESHTYLKGRNGVVSATSGIWQ